MKRRPLCGGVDVELDEEMRQQATADLVDIS